MAVLARSGERTLRPARRFLWKLIVAPLVVVTLALAFAAAAATAYESRALPGLSVGGVAIGSLEGPAIRTRLESELAAPWSASTVTLTSGGSVPEPTSLGLAALAGLGMLARRRK